MRRFRKPVDRTPHSLRRRSASLLLLLGLLLPIPGGAQPPGALSPGATPADSSFGKLELGYAVYGLIDGDMEETYGLLSGFSLRLAVPFERGAELFLGMSHIADQGNPYAGTWDAIDGPPSDLRAVPLELGVRIFRVGQRGHRFHLGAAVHYVWIREKLPGWRGTPSGAEGERLSFSGWGWGGKILAGPELCLVRNRLGLGVEVSLGGRTVTTHAGSRTYTATLSGLETRVYLAAYL